MASARVTICLPFFNDRRQRRDQRKQNLAVHAPTSRIFRLDFINLTTSMAAACNSAAEQAHSGERKEEVSNATIGLPTMARLYAGPEIKELMSYGCQNRMHVVQLLAPQLLHEDYRKDVDCKSSRNQTALGRGFTHTKAALAREPWGRPVRSAVGRDPARDQRVQGARGVCGWRALVSVSRSGGA
jgi:hypothetical protein